MTAPIALFVYKRLDHVRRTVEALRANVLAAESDLFVFADAPRDAAAIEGVRQVRDFGRAIDGFKSVTVVERETNFGVDASIIEGVTTLCARFGEVIVVEDDLVTSPWFLTFMNEGLRRYEDERQVVQISGFQFPVGLKPMDGASLLPFTTSWGWATWKRAWDLYDPGLAGYDSIESDARLRRRFNLDDSFDFFEMLQRARRGVLDAWDVRWYLSTFLLDGLTLFPNRSLVENIGFDGTGVHCPPSDFARTTLTERVISHFPPVRRDAIAYRAIVDHLKNQNAGRLRKAIYQIFGGIRRVPRLRANASS